MKRGPLLGNLAGLVLSRLPRAMQHAVRSFGRAARHHIRRIYRMQHAVPHVSKRLIVDSLRSIGLDRDSTVFVHSSMRSFGYVVGGPDTVIDALLQVIGSNGTLIMPAYAGFAQDLIGEPEFVFDVKNSPSRVGAISETLRCRPGVVRSIHPTHSVVAIGANALFAAEGHQDSLTPFGPNSPFQKLVGLDGYVLCLGVSIAHITLYHVVEDIVDHYPIPVYLDEPVKTILIDSMGERHMIRTRVHDPRVSRCRIDNSPTVEKAVLRYLERLGILKTCNIGGAHVTLMRAKALVNAMLQALEDGMTIYDSACVRRNLAKANPDP